MCLLQQMVTAVAQLHAIGGDLSHGALNPERVVVTPAGRIVVTEYVAGAGLASLGLTPQQAWQDYRLALPSDGTEAFTQASDVYQLGYLGLTLVSGRSILRPPVSAAVRDAAEWRRGDRHRRPHAAAAPGHRQLADARAPSRRAVRLGDRRAGLARRGDRQRRARRHAGHRRRARGARRRRDRRRAGHHDQHAGAAGGGTARARTGRPADAGRGSDLPAARTAVETPWTPPATSRCRRRSPAATPDRTRPTCRPSSRRPPTCRPPSRRPPRRRSRPADARRGAGAAPADPELPPAQAWTPKKRDISREVKVAKPAAISHALLGHDDSHSHASTSESGGKSKMLIIGGGIAAVAAIAAIVVFVVKPFSGSAAGTTPPTPPRRPPPARCRSTRRRGPACSSTRRRRAPRRCASICRAGVHRVRVEADGGLTKTIEVNVVAGKEIAQLVELTKGTPDRAAERAPPPPPRRARPPPPRRPRRAS